MKRNYSSPPRWTTLAPIAILLLVQCSFVAHAVSSSSSASSSVSSRSTRSSRSQQQRYRSSSSSSWLDTDIDSNLQQNRILRHQWHQQTHALFDHHHHTTTITTSPALEQSALEQLRGGGGDNHQKLISISNKFSKIASLSLTSIIILIMSIQHWGAIKSTFYTVFDTTKFRSAILQTLSDIASMGNSGLLLYTLIFIFWEVCGLPTSVVETAAGMAFGFRRAFLGSFLGKSLGSSLAFALGRTLLSDMVRQKLENVEPFGLIERGVEHHPIRSAFIVRYSVLPQIVKNFGVSMTKPVSYPIFLMTIVVHGFPFSLLWAALGYDSSVRLRASQLGEIVPKNYILNGLLVFVTVFGFVVSPAITGWWLADLRKEA